MTGFVIFEVSLAKVPSQKRKQAFAFLLRGVQSAGGARERQAKEKQKWD